MSGEPDSGTRPSGVSSMVKVVAMEIESSTTSNNNNSSSVNNNNNNNNSDENACDNNDRDRDRVTGSINFDHGSDIVVGGLKLRCERCDIFETHSRTLMMAHSAQCGASSQSSSIQEALLGGDRVKLESLKQEFSLAAVAAVAAAAAAHSNNNNQNSQDPNKRKCFECDVCNMKFSNGANMRRHKMRHTGVKPYECRVCQKRFFRKDHLAEHFTTHTKTLPYHCPICNRGFQRQIAMRAHFQNEHVGQHDLEKTCPLCSYRAGTMKSLRVHFFNRHGIDLDNPGPGAPSSLLLALDPNNAANFMPNLAVATVAAAAAAAAASSAGQAAYSDSGDSLRSTDNGTPPMHFLTPHVEISMATDNNDNFGCDHPHATNTSVATSSSSTVGLDLKTSPSSMSQRGGTMNHDGSPPSPHSAEQNTNIPSSSHSILSNIVQNSRHLLLDTSITPSISLIPIKQEPTTNDEYAETKSRLSDQHQVSPNNTSASISSGENSTPSSSHTSLIKVSPLKSLLREDIKRRMTAKANTRAARNFNNPNRIVTSSPSPMPTNLTGSNSSSSNNSLTITPEATPTSGCSIVATTSNGAITSTGNDTDMSLSSLRRNLQCLFCGIEFPDQTLYFLHKGCHSESNPWKCNICGEQCNNVYEFNSHLLSKSHQ